jgi:hypothetical protein
LNVPAKQRPDERIQHMYGEKASVFLRTPLCINDYPAARLVVSHTYVLT